MFETERAINHNHCEKCRHCVTIHVVSDDGEETLCEYCCELGKVCRANPEQIHKILFYQFIDMNRAIIEEVGI